MAVVRPDYDSAPRGVADAARHREKVKDAIKRNLQEILGNEAIITQSGNRVVRVPVRGLKSYRFVHGGTEGLGGGFGTGQRKKGKVLSRRPKPGRGLPGKPGEEPGVDYLETEIEIEELIKMMLEDLGLPNLREKERRMAKVVSGWKYDSIEKTGIHPRLDKKRSVIEAIKRTEVLVGALMEETGRSEDECREALNRTEGDMLAALELLRAESLVPAAAAAEAVSAMTGVVSHPYLDGSDLRYRTVSEEVEERSNAVVLAMMDVSGSMDVTKKYFARSFFFWMVSFLRTLYAHVEIRFIAHTTEAKLVSEEEFFHKGESGGTRCASAYELAAHLVETEYPSESWNIYPFHFSDGEDWDSWKSLDALRSLLSHNVSAFGYGEIQGEYSASVLMGTLERGLSMKKCIKDDLTYYEGQWGETPLVGVVLKGKKDLYPALRIFLSPERAVEARVGGAER